MDCSVKNAGEREPLLVKNIGSILQGLKVLEMHSNVAVLGILDCVLYNILLCIILFLKK